MLACVPEGDRRLGANAHANGGRLLRELPLPALEPHAVPVEHPGQSSHEPTRVLGGLLAELFSATGSGGTSALFGPDETASNHLEAVFDVTPRAWQARHPADRRASGRADGRVLEVLSEHLCQGWLEGYLLTGRHGLFACYEAFAHIVASMAAQHVKWLRRADEVPWRRPLASLNYLLTSHAWRQDHNGFSHQDPGFIDHIMNKSPRVVRVYLPPDANTLLVRGRSRAAHAATPSTSWWRASSSASTGWGSRRPAATAPRAPASGSGRAPRRRRASRTWCWPARGTCPRRRRWRRPSCCASRLPQLAVRVVNVVDIARLMPRKEHPHGLTDAEFDAVFTRDRPVDLRLPRLPVAGAPPGVPARGATIELHVRGYKEMGATTTPFDMVVRNDMDRYRLVMDVIDRTPGMPVQANAVRQAMQDVRTRHHAWIREHGRDLPEVADWTWSETSG